ncbi:hypothetical protein I4F81_008865 [Pyropia yezoensis]|uniref:Uncharacterized protein n=1 Tax=Pyropia yezoensis TaxID=2788 RepID=A0ACC3C8N4_PYRYE|nr:hypothetical protein I4F81_008865 [Neopyropia yezoensis]
MAGLAPALAAAARHGTGLPPRTFAPLRAILAADAAQTLGSSLLSSILPLRPDLPGRLTAGIDVLVVGCGDGGAVRAMAAAYPRSCLTYALPSALYEAETGDAGGGDLVALLDDAGLAVSSMSALDGDLCNVYVFAEKVEGGGRG